MRTNIVINDELMTEAMHLTGIKTKREVVEEALRLLIRTNQQKAVLGLRGKIRWDGDLQEMRQGRFMHESKAEYVTGEADNSATESAR
jgi:Arc/MetJ family transcription regulator